MKTQAAQANDRGLLFARCGDHEKAEAEFRLAAGVSPSFVDAWNNLALSLMQQKKSSAAETAIRIAVDLAPTGRMVLSNLSSILALVGKVAEAKDAAKKAVALGFQNAEHNFLFLMNYVDMDYRSVCQAHCHWGSMAIGRHNLLFGDQEPLPERTGRGLVRIGYVSGDFRKHPVASYIEPVIEYHSRNNFLVACYSNVPPEREDLDTARIKGKSDLWRGIFGKSDADVAAQIREDKIDILVDLAGHTALNRLGVFMHRPARVSVAWIGYLATTGLKCMNYRIVDQWLAPRHPAHGTEVCLEVPYGSCCWRPSDEAPPVSPSPATRNGYVTFGSTHSLLKLNADVYDIWSDILRRVPTSKLAIYHDTFDAEIRVRLEYEFTCRGIDGSRVNFLTSVGGSHLRAYDHMDVLLGTWPYSGGTTTCEALWQGVPTLALAWSDSPASRGAYAIMQQTLLGEFTAGSVGDLIDVAVRKTQDIEMLANRRGGFRRSAEIFLCDAKTFVAQYESAMRMALSMSR